MGRLFVDWKSETCVCSEAHELDSVSVCAAPFSSTVFRRNPHGNFIFMQDNAPIHVSRSTRAWLQRKNVPLLDWPANSPDLNPMENLWGILVRRIYAENQQYHNVDELKKAIVAAWHTIDQEVLDNLLSMDNRIFQVIRNNGDTIDY